MAKKVLLHTQFSTFSTYHSQGELGIAVMQNPSIYNLVLNNSIMLFCEKRFLKGYTSPEVFVRKTTLSELSCAEIVWMPCRFFNGYVHCIIKNALDQGFYVGFSYVDDYWIKGKSFYKEKHRLHDGIICGYDQAKKSYYMFAYDENWIFRVFETPQSCFEKSIKSAQEIGTYSALRFFRAKTDKFPLDIELIIKNLKLYLESDINKYPLDEEEYVLGTAVHDYVRIYMSMLQKGEISCEYADRRTMRMIWEHKKCMLDRIKTVESFFKFGHSLSNEYKEVVRMADRARILYAMFIKNKRTDILGNVSELIGQIQNAENDILNRFIGKTGEYI
ncbi:MAG: hypothetical protein SPF92_08530 [Clostridia bacterium]|nr:hypothetical protein [Clostridia bacterium]